MAAKKKTSRKRTVKKVRDAPPAAEVPQDKPNQFPIVGVGASAGGLEAVSELLSHLPAEPGLSVVVVQHLDPDHKSELSEILARLSSMPVDEIRDEMVAKPNRVYVIPPGAEVSMAGSVLRLTPRARKASRPYAPIDHFLRSLADDRGELSVGVILSGTGSDGTLGLQAIKGAGGITFAQDETAAYSGMPHSAVAAGHLDFVLPPAAIADELLRIARHPFVREAKPPAGPATDELRQIVRLLSQRTGVDFLNYKQETLRRRIERRMALRRLLTPREYLLCLQQDPAELPRLFQDVLIPVTSFFRDPDVFDELKQSVFPRLAESREPGEPLRIWVPGCSTGEEAYSLAICLLEFLDGRGEELPRCGSSPPTSAKRRSPLPAPGSTSTLSPRTFPHRG